MIWWFLSSFFSSFSWLLVCSNYSCLLSSGRQGVLQWSELHRVSLQVRYRSQTSCHHWHGGNYDDSSLGPAAYQRRCRLENKRGGVTCRTGCLCIFLEDASGVGRQLGWVVPTVPLGQYSSIPSYEWGQPSCMPYGTCSHKGLNFNSLWADTVAYNHYAINLTVLLQLYIKITRFIFWLILGIS